MPPSRRSGNPAARAAAARQQQSTRAKKTTGKKSGGYSLAKYREEATGEPFPFEVDDGHVIEIPRPTGGKMVEFAEKYGQAQNGVPVDPREQLRDLLGETYDEVMPILEEEDFGVMFAFLRDLAEYFDLGEVLASLG